VAQPGDRVEIAGTALLVEHINENRVEVVKMEVDPPASMPMSEAT
jgi:hypothetical protein